MEHFTGFASRLLEQGPTPRNGNKSDKAHPPIHPTKYTDSLQVSWGFLRSRNVLLVNYKF